MTIKKKILTTATILLTSINAVSVGATEDVPNEIALIEVSDQSDNTESSVEISSEESVISSSNTTTLESQLSSDESKNEEDETHETYSEEIYVKEEKDEFKENRTETKENTEKKAEEKIDNYGVKSHQYEDGETFISYTDENISDNLVNYVTPTYIYTGDYDNNNPLSWKQGNAPYSNRYFAFSGTNFGDASCGVHTMANIMLKSGYKDLGFNAEDAYEWALDNGIGSNYDGMPAYNWQRFATATEGYLQYEGMGHSQSWIRQEYAKGNFVVISVTINGIGHLVALDYVGEDGTIYIVDSAIRAKYLDDMDGGGVHYAISFSNKDIKSYNAPKLWAGDKISDLKKININNYTVEAPKENIKIENSKELKELEKRAEELQEDLSNAKKEVEQVQAESEKALSILNTATEAKDKRIQELTEIGVIGRILENGISFESIFNHYENDTLVSNLSKEIDTYKKATEELDLTIKDKKEKENEIVKKLALINSEIFSIFEK